MRTSFWPAVVAGCVWLAAGHAPAHAQAVTPGDPFEYEPFFPDKWKDKGLSTTLTPWEGKHVVLLTTTADLDGTAMARFLDRLDAGWKLYADLIGQAPAPNRHHRGKPLLVAVPDASYTCGYGCGQIGATGIEVAGFYKDHFGGPGDFALVRKNPDAFAHYYFYEMGRNYFVFGDRHNAFTTGFAVFMRYVCMDTLRCFDPDRNTRAVIDRAEAVYADAGLTFDEAFLDGKGLKDAAGKPIVPTDQNVMVASVMLKLRKDHGGDAWVKRFYEFLRGCPPLPPTSAAHRHGQALFWVLAASAAAKQDLAPVFEKRWRFPVRPDVARAMKAVDWRKPGLTADAVLDALPADALPFELAVRRPTFLTPERKKKNLVIGGTFESGAGTWGSNSFRGDGKAVRVVEQPSKKGRRVLAIQSAHPGGDDASYVQRVRVRPNTRYLLSGWAKTKGVAVIQDGGNVGANLCLMGGYDRTDPLVGSADWTYLTLVFESGNRTEVEVGARLGFYGSTAVGTAWFDDVSLIDLGPAAGSN